MIEWYWVIIALMGGAAFGVIISGLVSTNDRGIHKNWWEE